MRYVAGAERVRLRSGIRRTCARRLGCLAGIGIAMVVLTLAFATAAEAHAIFVSASPAPGAVLAAPPATLTIVFSEPLVPALSSVQVDTSAGVEVNERSAGVDASDHSAYDVVLPALKPDRFTVIWHTTSAIDGHTRWGSYTFTVLEPGGAQPPIGTGASRLPSEPAPLPTPLQGALSWAGLAGLFLLTGSVLMFVFGAVAREPVRRTFARLLLLAGLGTLVGVAGQFVATWAGTGWQPGLLGSVLSDGAAQWWWLRLAGMAAALLAWPRPGRLAGSRRRAVLVVAVLAMVVSFAASGHGAASPRPAAGLAFMIVHVLAASLWLGGVLALATIWGLARRHGTTARERHLVLRRFSIVAGMAVPAVFATGAASALLELGSITDFIRSNYGTALLIKFAVVAAVCAVAVRNVVLHRRGPIADPRRIGRIRLGLWMEAGLGLAVLVPTAAMSVLGPARPADAAHSAAQRLQVAADPAAAFAGIGTLGGRDLELSLTPGTAGPNSVQAELDGTAPATALQVRLTGPGGAATTKLSRVGYDHDPQTHTIYQGEFTVGAPGTWSAVVSGPAGASPPILVPLRAAPVGSATTSASPPRLDDWLVAIAVLGAAGVAVACARGRRWRGVSLAVGGACAVAGLVGVGLLSVATESAMASAVTSSWGLAHRASPTTANGATTWPIGSSDAGLMMPAAGPDGALWVGEMAANKLARLQPDDNVVQEIALPGGYKEVMGVAVDSDNHVWMAEEHAQALGMFDPATGAYRQYSVPGDDPAPSGIAVDAEGTVWFTEMGANAIGSFDPSTSRFTDYPVPTANALPYWLAIGSAGQVWFSEFGSGKLGALDTQSGRIVEYPLAPGNTPAGVAIDRSGTVWAVTAQGTLVRLDPSTGAMRTFDAPVADEYGVAVDTAGTVWLGTASGDAVYSFDPAAATFAEHPLPAGSNPWWVAVDQDHVWVALSSQAQGGLSELKAVG